MDGQAPSEIISWKTKGWLDGDGRCLQDLSSGRGGEVAELWAWAARRAEWGMLRDPNATEVLAPALRLFKAAAKTIVHARRDPVVVGQVRAILEDARQQIQPLTPRRKR